MKNEMLRNLKYVGPALPFDVWWDRQDKAERQKSDVRFITEAESRLRQSNLAYIRLYVIRMAREGAHGREIRDYLVERAPLRVDPAAFIDAMVEFGLIVRSSLDPYPNQYAGGLYGNPICHPTHYRYCLPQASGS